MTMMKDQLDPEHFPPHLTAKNYFICRAKCIREGKCKIGEVSTDVMQNLNVAGTASKR